MRTKGFSLVELLAVIVILALVALLISLFVVREIDNARGNMLVSEARTVRTAAVAVTIELSGLGITDGQYMTGLTGLVDDLVWPVETRISNRINELLAPEIILGAEPGDGVFVVTFVVLDGEIISMTCRSALGGRHYVVMFDGGGTTVVRE